MELEKKKELVQAVLDAPSACAELKEAAAKWMGAAGTDKEKEAGNILIAELEDDVMPIDAVIGFFGSKAAEGIFGAEKAAGIKAHMEEVKAAGGRYCDCPACTAGKAILDVKKEFM